MRIVKAGLLLWAAFAAALPPGGVYDLAGHLSPDEPSAVTIFGDNFPYTASTLSAYGRFEFKKLLPGPYTVSVFIPERGEARKTVEIGPALADAHGRVTIEIKFQDSDFELADTLRRRHSVSLSRLAIPTKALREYDAARRDLQRHDANSAIERLQKAVTLAPQFADAWNEMGTIAYETRNYAQAEDCFRHSLADDPEAYEPLVNLGGVLVTVNRPRDALGYNAMAVQMRDNDALAHSQLGMTYFELGDLDRAAKELDRARRLDPAHFSHPQLLLVEIYLRRGERDQAKAAADEFLHYHPDWPEAAKLRNAVK